MLRFNGGGEMRTKDSGDLGLTGFVGLGAAVVLQAVDDWRALCADKKVPGTVTFTELERFFRDDCDKFLVSRNVTGDKILAQLQKERVKSGHASKIELHPTGTDRRALK